MIDKKPIQLLGKNIVKEESRDFEIKMIHPGAEINFIPKQILVRDTNWFVFPFEGRVEARIFIRLYRGQWMIKEEDIFKGASRSE